LDYKIKELKKDIAPKEKEISNLKEQTYKMDQDLRSFNKVNSNLGFLVDDLRTKQAQMQKLITNGRESLRQNNNYIQDYKTRVYDVL